MSEEERLKLENELLMTKSKAMMINLYLDKLEEIERLNNIINELERHLEQQWLEWKDDYNDEIVAMANEDKCILEKLKELKGDSGNE